MTEEMSLAVFDPIKAQLAELTEKDAKLVFDHTTAVGEQTLRSYVARLRGYKGDIKRAHETGKSGALAFGRKVDAIKNELTAGVQKIIDDRMKPLDEIEAKKRAEAEALIEAERLEAARIEAERLAALKKREDAVARKEAEQQVAEEAANAEQQQVEQAEREKCIAESAAQTAREEAEEKARAEAEAETQRIRREAVAAQAETDRLAEIERRRIADRTHRSKIDAAVEMALRGIGIGDDAAHEVAMALVQGNIPHITINY